MSDLKSSEMKKLNLPVNHLTLRITGSTGVNEDNKMQPYDRTRLSVQI